MTRGEAKLEKPCLVILGVGNEYRGDDAAGLIAVRRLREALGDHIRCREENGEGTALMEAWKEAEAVILVDATRSGTSPGTLHRFDVTARSLPATLLCYSTHAFGVAEAIELARALGQLPARFIVYGIEGKNFETGSELSVEAKIAVEEAVGCVRQELERWTVR
ncbi:MAG: hydrogenase maturation protease [Candidatus Binatia bacterium]